MPNFVQSLKAEIVRLSRKEVKTAVKSLRSSNVNLKKSVALLKKKTALLEAENRRLSAFFKKTQASQPQISPEGKEKVRFTSKSILKLRTKRGLSQESFAKLLGVSSQNVYAMEHKQGRLKLRAKTLLNLLPLRGMGKREAKKRIDEMKSTKQVKVTGKKKAKRKQK
jgi:DNA-binding transcriptional regulator YiaG